MSTKNKILLTILAFALPALPLGRVIWPPSPNLPMPTSGDLPFFIFLAVVESLAFGIGIAFAFFGYSYVRRITAPYTVRALLAYLCIVWQLVSWWPHDNLHMHIGTDAHRLLYIEYGFHITLIISSIILAYVFVAVVREKLSSFV